VTEEEVEGPVAEEEEEDEEDDEDDDDDDDNDDDDDDEVEKPGSDKHVIALPPLTRAPIVVHLLPLDALERDTLIVPA